MRAVKNLPEGYKEIYSLDLQNDKKLALIVNLIGLVVSVLMIVPMNARVPITALFDMEGGLGNYTVRFVSLMVLMVLYLVLHEAVHGVAMKMCGTEKIKYGFTGLYAFAGSDDYYGKGAYIFIALAPVVLWGIVLAIINPMVPAEWFWVVYFIQIANVSGAAGDLFVTARFARLPDDILVRDSGVAMTVYSPK